MTTKYGIGYCNCGLTFDTRRSGAVDYDTQRQITMRSIRAHLEAPHILLGTEAAKEKAKHHTVMFIETKVQILK